MASEPKFMKYRLSMLSQSQLLPSKEQSLVIGRVKLEVQVHLCRSYQDISTHRHIRDSSKQPLISAPIIVRNQDNVTDVQVGSVLPPFGAYTWIRGRYSLASGARIRLLDTGPDATAASDNSPFGQIPQVVA